MPPTQRCPACAGFLSLVLIEPHVVRDGIEIRSFVCVTCATVVAQIAAISASRAPRRAAA